jgi:hypothetical protein
VELHQLKLTAGGCTKLVENQPLLKQAGCSVAPQRACPIHIPAQAIASEYASERLVAGGGVDRALVAGGYLKIVQTDGHRFVRITDKGREALAAAEIQ